MKNIIKTSAVALLLGGTLVSCNDFLTVDPVDKPVLETFYTSATALRSTTMALYSSKAWSNFHMNFQWKMDMINGDIFYTYSDEGQWYFGTYTSVNPYLNEGWKGLYNVILDANSIIHDIIPVCSGTITQADKDQAIGEARAFRGYCHYMLAEVWHDVPIIENNTELISQGILDVPRNTQASVYRFAMEDLDAAVELLPDTETDAFRLDKRKARALRAKLAVTMAAHTDYGYDRDALYAKAAEDALFVIENTQALTQIDFATLFDVESNNGPESILAIQCGVLGYSYGNARNVAWSRSSVIADQTWGAGKGPTLPGDVPATLRSISQNSLEVEVPEGAVEGPVTVTSIYGSGESTFHYMDTRGMMFDFDGLTGLGNHGWHNAPIEDDGTGISGNYMRLGDGATTLAGADAWDDNNFSFEYWAGSWNTPTDYPEREGVRLFDIVDFSDYNNMSLKFELCIPSNAAWQSCAMQLIFAGTDEVSMGNAGTDIYGNTVAGCNNSYFQGTSARGLWTPWTATEAYHTDGKWITVTLPIKDFVYAPDGSGASTFLSSPEDFASFQMFLWNGGVTGVDCTPMLKIDNIRAVKN